MLDRRFPHDENELTVRSRAMGIYVPLWDQPEAHPLLVDYAPVARFEDVARAAPTVR